MRRNAVSFANFVCKFGDKANLIDYAETIIIPAFTDTKLFRKYSDSKYFFHEVKVENVGSDSDPRLVISGRFIKDTKLTRTQIFNPERGLEHNIQSIRSAPSAYFVLMFENHRLIYFGETSEAPDIKAFTLTAAKFIKKYYNIYLRLLQKERNSIEEKRTTLAELENELPPPEVTVVPLTSASSIADFLKRYSKLNFVQFQLIRPNDEVDAEATFAALREARARMGATSTTLTHRSSDGLNTSAAATEIEAATATGNQITTLNGKDRQGHDLRGNNENFQLSLMMAEVPPNRAALLKKLVGEFDHLSRTGAIQTGRPTKDPKPRMLEILKSIF